MGLQPTIFLCNVLSFCNPHLQFKQQDLVSLNHCKAFLRLTRFGVSQALQSLSKSYQIDSKAVRQQCLQELPQKQDKEPTHNYGIKRKVMQNISHNIMSILQHWVLLIYIEDFFLCCAFLFILHSTEPVQKIY